MYFLGERWNKPTVRRMSFGKAFLAIVFPWAFRSEAGGERGGRGRDAARRRSGPTAGLGPTLLSRLAGWLAVLVCVEYSRTINRRVSVCPADVPLLLRRGPIAHDSIPLNCCETARERDYFCAESNEREPSLSKPNPLLLCRDLSQNRIESLSSEIFAVLPGLDEL